MKHLIIFFLLIFAVGCKPNTAEIKKNELVSNLPSNYPEKKGELNKNQFEFIFNDTLLANHVNTALKNNFDLLIESEYRNMFAADLRVAKALRLPTVSAFGSAGIVRFGKYTMDGVGNFDTNFSPNITEEQQMSENLPDLLLGFNTQWEIDVWGKLRNQKIAALNRFLASDKALQWLRVNITYEVASTYFSLVAINQKISILQDYIAIQEKGLAVIKMQKDAGMVNELAVDQYEAQLFNFKAQAAQITVQKISLENKLALLKGSFNANIPFNSEYFLSNNTFEIKLGSPEDLLINRPDVKEAEFQLLASKADVKSARAAFFPTVEIDGLLGFQSFNPAFFLSPESITFRLFGGLIAPIFNRNQLRANFKYQQSAEKVSLYQYQKIVTSAYFEVYNASLSVDNFTQVAELKAAEVKVLNDASFNANQLFTTGKANYLELIFVQNSALQAQLELMDAKLNQHIAFLNLYKTLGGF
ncbi:MAG: TolC family protein [Luteibaculaceae bacterium]